MNRKTVLLALITVLSALTTSSTLADTIYVNADGSGDYTTIQAGINAAVSGVDTVEVAEGTYYENIKFNGKDIVLTSTNPSNPNVVKATIIDGGNLKRVVKFDGSETSACELTGFTITNGNAYTGGGVLFKGAHALISNCIIVNNTAEYGGGLYHTYGDIINCVISNNSAVWDGGGLGHCDGKIANCEISNNSAYSGGGLAHCDGVIKNCDILNNTAYKSGGGLYRCYVSSIKNCTISGNSATTVGGGGGLEGCHGRITNCVISNNSAKDDGGGLSKCAGYITNCTIVGNATDGNGGGLWDCESYVTNCIIWANSAGGRGDQIYYGSKPTYSCIQEWTGGGNNNITDDPLFVEDGYWDGDTWFDGDYRLQEGSPCIDRGKNSVVTVPTDFDGNPRIINGVVDMGAYEFPNPNRPPVADAGDDQIVYSCSDELAEVKLDGSGSFDPDGDELTYMWCWTVDSNEMTATGVDPNIKLPVFEHTIELIVNDGQEDSEPNEVVITVIGLVEADVHIVPRTINRRNRMKRIMAIIRLPEGIGKHDIADEPFVLEPGGIEAIWDRVIVRGNQATVFALFDKDEVMDALPNTGRVELTVTGRLESGQCLSGTDIVRIVQPRRRARGLRRR